MDANAPSRKPRGFKIALISILTLLFLFAAAIYLLPSFLPIDTIRQMSKAKAKEMTGLDLDFRSLGFSWSGSVVLGGIVVSPAAAEGMPMPEPLLTVDEVKTNVAIAPLLSGKIVINSVEVNGFSVRLRRAADGSLNLPDFSRLTAGVQTGNASENVTSARSALLSAVAAESAANPLANIELRRLELRRGILSFEDEIESLAVDLGVDFFRVEGATFNDPFVVSGRVFPYAIDATKGEIPFTGRVAMIKNGALDLNGEASLEVDVKAFSLHELAAKLGLGELLVSGMANGIVKLGYAGSKAILSAREFHLAEVVLGLDDNLAFAAPDSSFSIEGEFDAESGVVAFSNLGLVNQLIQIQGSGWVEDIPALAAGGMPVVALEYGGTADFSDLIQYLTRQNLGLPDLPELSGEGMFSGKVVLGKQENPADPPAPTLTTDFSSGRIAARDVVTDIAVEVGLAGVSFRAAASLGEAIDINSGITLANVPVTLLAPWLGREPINIAVIGGMAVAASSSGTLAAELRLVDATAKIPDTPWSSAMEIRSPDTRITYHFENDELTIHSASFEIGEGIRGGVKSGAASGILSGEPNGQINLELSASFDQLNALFQPLVSEVSAKLSGVLRAAARIRMDNGRIETSAQAEIDNAGLGLTIDPVGAQVEIPKTSIALSAGTHLTSPLEINLASLSIDTGGAAFRINESDGWGIAGRLGEMLLRAAGTIDLQAGQSEFSNLGINLNGLAVNLGQNNQQVAGLSSGVMRLIVAAPDHKVSLPLSSQGDFNLPALEAGADGLVFHRFTDGRSEDSDFGSLRAKLGIDGYIGEEKRQLINIRTASLSAKPLAVNSRGQFDLGNYAVVFEYAARLIPAGMASFLWFLDFPPSLLENADVSGVLNYDGQQATTRGAVQGNLRLASDQLNHFEMTHDISAAYQQNDKTLAVNVRRLDGNVKTGSGESVVLLAAQPSNLLLSPTDAKGILDIRLNGAAAPTRILAVGLAGVLPQLREYAKVLYQAQAEGVYTAWLQVQEKDSSGISLKAGGVWEGAALHVDGVPYLSEAQKLSAALEGDWSLRDNRINLSRLFFRTDSGQIQADGAASMTLSTNGSGNVNGISDVNINLRFVMADLARTALTFPGLIPADFGLTGRIDGSFQAGGGSDDIRVSEGRMRFQGFQAKPGGFDVAIPSGTATFDAAVALALNAPINQPSPYDALKLFNIRNGQAALTGAQFKGQNVNTLSGSFQLQNGLLTLLSGNMEVDDGGAAAINGTVDFNRPAPAVNLSLMAHNIQLANANPTLHEYMEFQSGSVNLPAAQGQAAGVSFQGFSEDEILHSLRLENFTFTTGPVTIHTGPVLNEELDRATSRLMKQEMGGTGQARLITLNSVSGVVQAAGNGVITIPADNPIQINGNNTGDFRVQGVISADQTLNLDFFIVGKLENLFGTTMPSIIPSFRSGGEEERSRFMTRMNQNAAAGHYRVNISGPWGQPNLAGIGLLAGRFIADMAMAVPGQIVGGVVSTPGNIVRGIGSLLGAGGSQASEHPEADQPDLSPLPTTPQAEPAERERGGFRLPFIR